MPKSWVLPAQDLIFQLLPGMILPLISNSGSRKEVLSRSKRPPEANRPLELTQRRRLCAFSGPGEAPCVEEKMRLQMLPRAQARMARGTTAVAHTISKTS